MLGKIRVFWGWPPETPGTLIKRARHFFRAELRFKVGDAIDAMFALRNMAIRVTRGKTRARTKRAWFLPGKIIGFQVKGRRA